MRKSLLILLAVATCVLAVKAELVFTIHEEGFELKPQRERVVSRPRFYAEFQSYRLVENYLHYWLDRPLFHDSSLRGTNSYGTSFLRNVDIVEGYEIDGFVTLANGGALRAMYRDHLATLRENPPAWDFTYMLGAGYGSLKDKKIEKRALADYLTSYKRACDSPHTWRVDGKIPLWGYHTHTLSTNRVMELKQRLHQHGGVEPIFFAQLNDNKFREFYQNNGALDAVRKEQLRQALRMHLNAVDGLIVNPVGSARVRGDYVNQITSAYFQECYLPIALELLREPAYAGKLVGAYIKKGYINHLSGNISGEYGTARFRRSMEMLSALNPDVVVFFEWNEANENTHFQPTIRDGRTMRRLVRFYARAMRGEPPIPLEGDDISIPNLVLSSRQVLRLGDTLRYELLNIPDSDSQATCHARLSLYDINGQEIVKLPEAEFTVGKLRAVTYEIASEQLAEHQVIAPRLRVTTSDGKQNLFTMQYTRIHPSVCWDYKETMQPLRDILPLESDFQVAAVSGSARNYRITAHLSAPEELAQVEVTDNEREVYAIDRSNRYNPAENIVIQGSLTAYVGYSGARDVSFELHGAPGWRWFQEYYRGKPDGPDPAISDNRVVVPAYRINYYYPQPFTITIPRDAATNACLRIEVAERGSVKCEIAELLRLGRWARAMDQTCRLDLRVLNKLADIPPPLKQRRVEFTTELTSESRLPLFQLRAIGHSGRIYRGVPCLPHPADGPTIDHTVWSATQEGPTTVRVVASTIPELKYRFDPAYGALLACDWESFFDGQLGGGFIYLEPFNRPGTLFNHTSNRSLAPAWRVADGYSMLEFDGEANYINLPREALPYGAFTLEFEIKPANADNQVLFRSISYHNGSLNLYRRHGELESSFTYTSYGPFNPQKTADFQTELHLPAQEWSKVRVSYNYRELAFTVNGRSRSFPFSERGRFFKSAIFGGHLHPLYAVGHDMKFFKGELRTLRITHTAQP